MQERISRPGGIYDWFAAYNAVKDKTQLLFCWPHERKWAPQQSAPPGRGKSDLNRLDGWLAARKGPDGIRYLIRGHADEGFQTS